ncbi:MAG: type II toxin-antitoxin system VapC family toxin [Candidatus Binatia bacterium]
MILYVDTSALVKLYVPEPESGTVQALVGGAQVTAVSLVAFAEARAAFARKRRERAVNPKDYRLIVREFDDDWDHYFVVDVTEPLVKRAAQLVDKHGLRGYDAIHLSSAIVLREQSGEAVSFCCFDGRLLRASRREGLKPAI